VIPFVADPFKFLQAGSGVQRKRRAPHHFGYHFLEALRFLINVNTTDTSYVLALERFLGALYLPCGQ
jgi:hypothetical protein